MKHLVRVWCLLSIFSAQTAFAQLHPVQATTQLVPPYSVYLSDYASPGNDKLRLVMLQRDVTKPSYQLRLKMTVELNGKVVLQTSSLFNPAPITLDAGIPVIISGSDLQPYVDSRNLDFIGISRDDYERTKALPEGNYQICFTAFDYHRQDVAVSLPACSFFWLAKDEPPMVNYPPCGTTLPFQNPQQIVFSWLPRNTSSPNSANDTQYEFSLYESRPAGRNPNDVVLSSPVVFQTTTENTQFVYSISEPILLENMNYVWRVRAIDKSGKDLFRNNGYSEVCTFTYGGNATAVNLDVIKDLLAEGVAERKGKASWTAQADVGGYQTNYRKKGSSNWYNQQSTDPKIDIVDLEPDTEYEVRVQAFAGPTFGPYSDTKNFKTPKPKVFACGEPLPAVPDSVKSISAVYANMIVNVQGIELMLKEVEGPYGANLYKGKGEVSIPYFGGAVFHVTFKDLFITENRMAGKGRIDFNTQKVDDWIKDEIAQQKKDKLAEQQQANRDKWKGTDFYEKVIYYNDSTISKVEGNSDGNVIITGDGGQTYINPEITKILKDAPDKAIIIEDKSGNQWVVQKDKETGAIKATQVPGGGLSPNMDVVVTDEAVEYINKGLLELALKYPKTKLDELAGEMKTKESLLQSHIEEQSESRVWDEIEGDIDTEEVNEKIEFITFTQESGGDDDIDVGPADEKHKSLSDLFYDTEREYRVGNIVTIFSSNDNIKAASAMIAPELKIGDQTVSQYIETQKKKNTSDESIVHEVAVGIQNLLGRLSMDTAMDDIKFQSNEK